MLALGVVAGAAWAAVAVTAPKPQHRDQPERLLNASRARVVAIDVVEPSSGRRVHLDGTPLSRLAADLAPLLAVRSLPALKPAYGLGAPFARLEARTEAGSLPAVLLGATNFDHTGYYVRIEGRPGAALVLMRIGDTAKAALAPTATVGAP